MKTIRSRSVLAIVSLFLLFTSGMILPLHWLLITKSETELSLTATRLAESVRRSLETSYYFSDITRTIQSFGDFDDLEVLLLIDLESGTVLASTITKLVSTPAADYLDPGVLQVAQRFVRQNRPGTYTARDVIYAASPVYRSYALAPNHSYVVITALNTANIRRSAEKLEIIIVAAIVLMSAVAAIFASGFITRNLLHPLRRFEKYFAALNEGGSEAVLADEPYHEWNIVAQSIKEAIARMYEAQSKRSEFERNLALATQMAHLGVVQLNTNTGRLVIDRVILERMGLPNFKKISDMLASLARSDHLKLQEMLERLKRHQKVDLNLAFVNQKNEIVLAKIVAESVPGVGQFDVIGLLQDVTEAAHLERMKEDFVATVSHELRTPLTAIKGASALILQGALGTISPQVRASLELSSRNVLRLENLVNDILDMEKLSSGRFQFNLKELDVDEFMQEVKQANTAFTETANIDIELQNKLEMRESIRADKMRLHQVMTNFISNAVKYSPPNTSIILRAHRDNNDAVISLVDFGPGIQEDFKRYVFTKFSQAQASSTRNIQKGTGLGLAIAKEMVEHMGGTIGFSSVLGQGTEFWVRFALSSRHV